MATEAEILAANRRGPLSFGEALKAAGDDPKCSACGTTEHLRISGWHNGAICSPCFYLWFDELPPEVGCDPELLGAESRRRKGTGEWPYSMPEFREDQSHEG